jgi:hypothetical protein
MNSVLCQKTRELRREKLHSWNVGPQKVIRNPVWSGVKMASQLTLKLPKGNKTLGLLPVLKESDHIYVEFMS